MADYQEVVAPLPCFGNIGFYRHLLTDDLIIDRHEHYQKQSLRNRFELTGAQGRFFLTVPVEGQKGQKLDLKDIKISYHDDWEKLHRQTIQTNYGSAAFFEHYADSLWALYDKKIQWLADFNLAAHDLMCSFLNHPECKSNAQLKMSEDYIVSTPGTDLRLNFKRGTARHKKYIQVFADRCSFEYDLSVLDAIFCLGPEAGNIVTQRE